jgi:hypothetical protein
MGQEMGNMGEKASRGVQRGKIAQSLQSSAWRQLGRVCLYETEFENLADVEKGINKLMKSDFMTTLYPEFASLIVAGSYSISIWNSVS